MSGPYRSDIPAQPFGRFASQLEHEWSWFFEMAGWPHKYIGDRVSYADFFIEYDPPKGFLLEVKPKQTDKTIPEDEFLKSAVERFQENKIKQAMLTWGGDAFVWYCDEKLYGPIPARLIHSLAGLFFALRNPEKNQFKLPRLPVVSGYWPDSEYLYSFRDWLAIKENAQWKPIITKDAFVWLHHYISELKKGIAIAQTIQNTKDACYRHMQEAGCKTFLQPYVEERCLFGENLSVPVSLLQRDFDCWHCRKTGGCLSPGMHARTQEDIRFALCDLGIKVGTEKLPSGSIRKIFRGLGLRP